MCWRENEEIGYSWALAGLGFALLCVAGRAQTVEDGIMLSRGTICAGELYTHDSWGHYWEGQLERTNGNLGTVTTQAVTSSVNYGITSRLNVIGMVPFVWAKASRGVLREQTGFQDLTLAAKVTVLRVPVRQFGVVRVNGVVSTGLPMTGYTPDLQPLSIGYHSRTVSGRGTLTYEGRRGFYLDGSAAYMWRGNVTLARSSYFTNDQLYLSNQVAMPNQFQYTLGAGYHRRDLTVEGTMWEQQTRGGGDIRRQDLPFVSNRMNYLKAGGTVRYPLPRTKSLQYWATYAYTVDGRNVGQAQTWTTGLMYQVHFERRGTR